MTQTQGGCHCGDVRFQAAGSPKFVSRCHCESCRKTTGAAFSTWVGFNADAVAWTTEPPAYYASSPGVRRGYCKACGTPLSYESDKWPGERHFLIGVFDNPRSFTPTSDFQRDEALDWTNS